MSHDPHMSQMPAYIFSHDPHMSHMPAYIIFSRTLKYHSAQHAKHVILALALLLGSWLGRFAASLVHLLSHLSYMYMYSLYSLSIALSRDTL